MVLAEHDTEPTEMFGGLLKLLLAAVLILPHGTFESSRVYGMLSALPEPVWAAVLLVFGVVHLAAIRGGDRGRRRMMSLAGFLIWFTWAASFFEGTPTNTGGVVYMLAALMQGWCYVRLGRPA
jgi:hypothetical protein